MTTLAARRRPLFDDEQEALRESVARFYADEVAPAYGEWSAVPASLFAAAAEHGFVAMQVPEAHGGVEVSDPRFGAVLIEEAMYAGAPAVALGLGIHNEVCVPPLLASEERAARLAAGELVAAFVDGDGVTARPANGGGWTLDGEAAFVVNGGAAGVLVVAARLEGGGTSAASGSAAAEPTDARSAAAARGDVALFAVDAAVERAASEPLFGLGAADLADLRFSSTAAECLDADVEAARAAQRRVLAVAAVAGARAALDITIEYVRERKAFGVPIASFENTRMALADVAAEIEATEAFVDACVTDPSPVRAAVAKLRASELLARAVDAGVQLHGGYGYMVEYPIALAYVDARPFRLLGGTSEQLKALIAEAIEL